MHKIKYIRLYRKLVILKISKIMFKICDTVIYVYFIFTALSYKI